MGPDVFLMPLIGVAGTAVGVAATILVSRIKGTRKRSHSNPAQDADSLLIHGETYDANELRILRALFGESDGRRLESYKGKHYLPFLEATIEKGWVEQAGRRFYLTAQGADFCRTYLEQLLREWKPTQ